MTIRDFTVGQLALWAFREGNRLAPGSRAAMEGIAHVIRNRVKAGEWDGDWLKVLQDAPNRGSSDPGLCSSFEMPDIWSPDWKFIIAKCEEIYDGKAVDEITWSADFNKQNRARPAFYYANLQIPVRLWFKEQVLTNCQHLSDAQPVSFFG